LSTASGRGEIYLLGNDEGVLLAPYEQKPGAADVLHLFASRSEAERQMKRLGAKRVIADPLVEFIVATLPWAETRVRSAMIEPIAGAGFIEVKIAGLAERLTPAAALS
jgi:hypothetical protein